MEKVKEQIVLITNTSVVINNYLKDGWRVVSVTPGTVSTGGASQVHGNFCFVLEK